MGTPAANASTDEAAPTSWVQALLGPSYGTIDSGLDTVAPTNGTFGNGAGAAGPYDLGLLTSPVTNTSDLGLFGTAAGAIIDLGLFGT